MENVRVAGREILEMQTEYTARRDEEEPDPSLLFCRENRELARTVDARSMVLLNNDMDDNKPLLPLGGNAISSCAVVGRLANAANTGHRGSSNVRNPEAVTPFQGIKEALPEAEVSLSDSEDIAEVVEGASRADVTIVVVGYNAGDEGEYIIHSMKDNRELLKLFRPPDGWVEAKA